MKDEKIFLLQTKNSSYAFRSMPSGHLEHLHYGKRISLNEDGCGIYIMEPSKNGQEESLFEKRDFINGNTILYDKEFPSICLEDVSLEISSYGKGDIREPFIEISYADGSLSSDFIFESAEILPEKLALNTLPYSYSDKGIKQLKIILKERHNPIRLILYYSVFSECDAIARSAVLVNDSEDYIVIRRIMSTQLDFDKKSLRFTSFTGSWANEMNLNEQICENGLFINQTTAGVSSNRANPFVMISDSDTTESYGDCYGFHLVYSGNHYEALEVTQQGRSRFLSGINPKTFTWRLAPKCRFETPEAIMSFSAWGFQQLSLNIHDFVREHIVRGVWKNKPRPVLINSWEANYYSFDESKLLRLAEQAKNAGIELFVLDDGWFGNRNDDTSSLGDWESNTEKLPGGLKQIADKINQMGLSFGIWVEPEMISQNSELFKKHPEWAVKIPNRHHSEGRNQMIIDITNEEVRDFIVKSMTEIFSGANISYVKWDMNRIFSDAYSTGLENQGEFYHRYVMGLYEILEKITRKFPDILFESCGAGGNRSDLGMLCYMPQLWASDNTDAICRLKIQNGYSYGYPNSVIGAHVSDCPNHQTHRSTPFDTRFNVAAFGILGYEMNLELSESLLDKIRMQIKFYKDWRNVVLEGDFYRLSKPRDADCRWLIVSKDKKRAMLVIVEKQRENANDAYCKVVTKGLKDDLLYNFYEALKDEPESYLVKGININNSGIKLKRHGFDGVASNGHSYENLTYSSKLYLLESV